MNHPAPPLRNSSVQMPTTSPYAGRTPGAGARAERPSEARKPRDALQPRRGAQGPSGCDHRPEWAHHASA